MLLDRAGRVLRARRARQLVGVGQEVQFPGAVAGLLVRILRGLAVPGDRPMRNVRALGFFEDDPA